MNTTAVHIDTQLYNNAVEYARRHNTSIDNMIEEYFLTVLSLTRLEHRAEKQSDTETDKKSISASNAWQNHPISEKTKSLLPKRRVNIPTEYKPLLEQTLKDKYESIS